MKFIFFDFFNTLFTTPSNRNIEQVVNVSIDLFDKKDLNIISTIWKETYDYLEKNSAKSSVEFNMSEISDIMYQKYPQYDIAIYRELTDRYMQIWRNHSIPFEDTIIAVKKLSCCYSCGIISNTNDSMLIPYLLKKYNLYDSFNPIILSVDVGYKKPSTFIFKEALKKVCYSTVFFVGDNLEEDIKGAANCNMIPIHINRGSKAIVASNYHTIRSLFELEEKVRTLII